MATFPENLIATAQELDDGVRDHPDTLPSGAEKDLLAAVSAWLRHCAGEGASPEDVRDEFMGLFAFVLVSISAAEHDGAICESCISRLAIDLGIAVGETVEMMSGEASDEDATAVTGSIH